jgi:hypothetical protein
VHRSPPGRYVCEAPAGQVGGMRPPKRSSMPSEMGSTWLRSASLDHSSVIWRKPFGLLFRPVDGFGEVLRKVEELPAVLVEVATPDGQLLLVEHAGADVVGRRLPSVVVDRARAEHLEVLGAVDLAGLGFLEHRRRLVPSTAAGPRRRPLGSLDAYGGQDGRHQVDHVGELGADPPGSAT